MKKDIDFLYEQRLTEFTEMHKATIEVNNGNTYVGFRVKDWITEVSMKDIIKLLSLMDVEYSWLSFTTDQLHDDMYAVVISGDDQDRAAYIRDFIENGYKLKW